MRQVVNGVMYVLSTGCQWRYIPKDLPPRSTVHDYLTRWNYDGTIEMIHHALYVQCREAMGREASPTACVIDSQSVKSVEKGGPVSIRPGIVDGGVNPRKSGDDRKAGTRFAACDQPLLAIYRSDANGCPVALCQRRQPPKAGAVGQCLQRVAGQSSWTIKNDGWFRIAKVRLTRERPYAKTVRFSERPHRRLRADSRRRQQV